MHRRGFIRVMAAGGAVALFPPVLSGCSGARTTAGKQIEESNDIRLELISWAMLAPNSHNIQPWLIRLKSTDSFDLFVDPDRLLPKTDPPARQIHISQGTFLETLSIAASNHGYRAEISYFPEGEYGNEVIENTPVASVKLLKDDSIRPDPLFQWLQTRQSNKRAYSSRRISEQDLVLLRDSYTDQRINVLANGTEELYRNLAPLLGKSMAIEVADRDRNVETADLFRFSEEEADRIRDGFTVANNGITGPMRFIVENFFLGTREEAYEVGSPFAKEGVKLAYRQAESAAAYGWIVSESNTRLDQVKVGHIYARMNLLTARLGISQHPMSQILQEYGDMRELQQEFLSLLDIPQGSTVQMLYRLGYAEDVPHTRRRAAGDILLS